MSNIKITLSILIICFLLINCGDKKNASPDGKKEKAEKEAESIKEEKKAEMKTEAPKKVDTKVEDSKKPKEDAKAVVEAEDVPMTKVQLDKASEILRSVSKEDVKAINGKKVFKMYCASCHGFKGNMNVNGAKDLTKSIITMEESVAQVYFGKGLMTPFSGLLKDEEIVAVNEYIRENLRK